MTGRWRFIGSLAWRESRTARRKLLLYMSSISLGVGALVAIDSIADNVRSAVRGQARSVMGGDVTFSANARFPDSLRAVIDSVGRTPGIAVGTAVTFTSMAYVPRSQQTRLSEVRAVGPTYPPFGDVTSDPAGRWPVLQERQAALVSPATLIALDARLGDTLTIGYAQFEIVGTTNSVPGDPGLATAIGPRVFIAEKYVASTQLLGFGSRASFEAIVRLPDGVQSPRWVAPLRPRFQKADIRVRTIVQQEQNMTDSISRLSDFLGIVGMIALLLGGIGVASGVNAFVNRKVDTVAVLRCMGATGPQVLAIYVAQAALMGLAGAAIGTAIGIAIQFVLPALVKGALPLDVSVSLVPRAIGLGLAIGVWVALIFSLRPLLALRRVSPLQALRRDADALERARLRDLPSHLVNAGLVASVVALAVSRSDSVPRGLLVAGGIGASLLLLWMSAASLSYVARRVVARRLPYLLKQGVANLYRPANQTRSVVLALGFGAFLVSTLYLVQSNLLGQFRISADAARGNLVFFDIQPDQRLAIDSIVRVGGGQSLGLTPIVTMKIRSINGRSPEAWAAAHAMPARHWALQREYRSTYRDTLVATEKLVAGTWFDRAPGGPQDTIPQMSIAQDVAGELNVALGDTITWDVQGVPVSARITSVRDVNWGRFEPNFFAVFQPRALEAAPRMYVEIAAVSSDTTIARIQRDVVTRFPNASSVDLSLVRRTVGQIVARITIAVRFLALFSLAMAIPVLFSAVAATRRERLREGVLLKTLGATRAQIGRILLAEYALLGMLGALTGMLLSFAGAWGLVTFVFDGHFTPALLPAAMIALVMMALAVAIGMATGREVFRETPMVALRDA
ncbi:MAG TPA: FtsX-like permease family protein [Gemmatimonadaceae bacterium]|nr:FtsX-like permease family protein [Gemmatimonadaceae bacterium]